MTKRKISKLIAIMIIFIGISLILFKLIYKVSLSETNANKVNDFFKKETTTSIVQTPIYDNVPLKDNPIKDVSKNTNYVAILEIPSIKLKQGLVNKNSKDNNVNKNIQILTTSDMPDKEKGNTILASHSGTSNISYFKKLDNVKNNDLIYFYYNNIKYTFKVSKIYKETKDGDIWIQKDNSKTTLTLTTCSSKDKNKQLVVISYLISKDRY